jgi:tetratricopeptide (TPR) repeat protein
MATVAMHQTSTPDTNKAEELKAAANAAFQAHRFATAIELYSQAIILNTDNAVYWANRAFAHTKMEEYGSAVEDATKAITISPTYVKVAHMQNVPLWNLLWSSLYCGRMAAKVVREEMVLELDIVTSVSFAYN